MGIVVIILLILALVFGPGIWVQRVLDRYSEPADRYSLSGAEVARKLLDVNNLQTVKIEATETGDHYDPTDKTVRLTPDKMTGRSLTAVTVAAHEVGHALQDSTAYGPLRLRTLLVKVVGPVQKLGAGVLMVAPIIGALTRLPQLGLLMFAGGFLTLATTTLVHFVTLPTEFDASFARALPMLDEHRILRPTDRPHARKLLTAAALTYVAASLMSLLNIARWWSILRR
ncbi:MAG: zinc metallopeptidase [Woeseiaceae bacterium]|nr:zinc metallopeptidase [Woeseiaceae bacterium]